MSRFSLGVLARAAGAEIVGGALPAGVEAVGTDSRSLPRSSLFVALRGERFDGHEFVGAAIDNGARAVLIDREGAAALGDLRKPALVVDDTLVALGDMARQVRVDRGGPVAAVTGSNGKTTTKELLAAALGSYGGVHKNSGNFNNLIGLPLTVFAWPRGAWAAVLEMGMNAPGEITRLTEIAAPDVGLVTNVGPAHLEGLGTIEAVARAKGELYASLAEGATCVLNVDDPMVRDICVPLAGRRPGVFFGTGDGCDVRVVAQTLVAGGSRVILSIDGTYTAIDLPLVGVHNALNAAGAAAAAWALGVSPQDIAAGMSKVTIPGGRLRVLSGDVTVVDDTYNANPASMRAAFGALAQLATGRRVVVLGDMFELGEHAARLHREVGAAAVDAEIALVVALGEHAGSVAAGARERGAAAESYSTLEELLGALDASVRPGDWVLVKGSRGMRMERVVEHLHGERG